MPAKALWLGVGPLAGGLFAFAAYTNGPLMMPAVLTAIAAIGFAIARRGAAVAIAVVLIPLGSIISRILGVVDWEPYAPILVWSVVLAAGVTLSAQVGGWRRPPMTLAVIAYAIVSLVALIVGGDLAAGAQPLRFIFVGTLLFLATALLIRERSDLSLVLRGVAVAVIAVGGLALRSAFGGESGGAFATASGDLVDRTSAGFSHPNVLGGYLAFLVPLLIAGVLLDRNWRALYIGAVVLAVGAIYLSFSRGALVGLALAPLFFLPLRRALWLLPAVGLLVLFLAPDLLRERFATLGGGGSELGTRLDFWNVSLAIWADHPVLGVGLGGFPEAYAESGVSGRSFLPGTLLAPPPHAHNIFLNHLVETGILGLAAITTIVLAALRHALSLRRALDPWTRTIGSALLAVLFVFLLSNQFEVTMIGELGETVWIVFGILSAVAAIHQGEPRPLAAPQRGSIGAAVP